MANISSYLQKILSAVFGEEVRGSIHDALAAMNMESSSAMEFAATAQDSAQASAAAAAEKAEEASDSATAAETSARNAQACETNAQNSETVAVEKAAEAGTAAEGAKASETAAAASEASAVQKAGEAADSQAAAALSETLARVAEERTTALKTDVEAMRSQVEADRIAADAARDDAETARDSAAESEGNALHSANAAQNAEAGAGAARDDAEVFAASALASKTDAEAAKLLAETASDAAGAEAASAAVSANEAAESAHTAQQYSGKPPKPQNGTWWIWDPEQQAYLDTRIGCELVGPIGIGVRDIQLTSGNHAPGTTDIYTVTLTDENTYDISVYNGRNGTGSGDVLGIWFDLVIPAAGWENGEVTIEDGRLLALATHKYFLSASQESREEFLECNVQPKDITRSGFLTFSNETDPTGDLSVQVIRFELAANSGS